jgi:hypothetical protein
VILKARRAGIFAVGKLKTAKAPQERSLPAKNMPPRRGWGIFGLGFHKQAIYYLEFARFFAFSGFCVLVQQPQKSHTKVRVQSRRKKPSFSRMAAFDIGSYSRIWTPTLIPGRPAPIFL